jgi:ATP-dependent DNA helicase RecQ
MKEGVAVVISPLIALMKDQVDGLKEMGIAADCLNSSLPQEEQRTIVKRCKAGRSML